MIYYEIKKALFKMFIPFQLLFLIIAFFMNILLEAGVVIWFSTIYFIVAFGMIYTININDKYRSEIFERQLKLKNSSNFWMRTKLILIPFTVVFISATIFLGIIITIAAFGGLKETNFVGKNFPLSLKDGHWGYFAYEMIITIMMVVLLTNFFYRFFKNRTFLYAIVIIYLIYYLWFGNLFFSIIQPNGKKFSYDPNINHVRLNFNYVFLPWTQVTSIGREVLNPSYIDVNLFNYSGINGNIILYLAPYATISLLLTLNIIDTDKISKLNFKFQTHSK